MAGRLYVKIRITASKKYTMIAFIDTEVSPQTKRVADYGAVREDGAVMHTHSKADFDAFVSGCDTILRYGGILRLSTRCFFRRCCFPSGRIIIW